jgi:pimeloyl-ACP methyl ester carboxylesterase
VLLLSPFPESLFAFTRTLPDLSRVAPLVALDLPGFGQSEGRAALMSPRAMGTFVTKALAALGLSLVVDSGHFDRVVCEDRASALARFRRTA